VRGWTCSTLFGPIAVTGLRVSETIGLDDKDVDLNEAVLLIRRGKNGKCRFVPLSPCAAERLSAQRTERNRLVGTGSVAFFLKGYHSSETMIELVDVGLRSYLAEPNRGRRDWSEEPAARTVVYANRRRVRGARGRRLRCQRGERIERSFAHLYDTVECAAPICAATPISSSVC